MFVVDSSRLLSGIMLKKSMVQSPTAIDARHRTSPRWHDMAAAARPKKKSSPTSCGFTEKLYFCRQKPYTFQMQHRR